MAQCGSAVCFSGQVSIDDSSMFAVEICDVSLTRCRISQTATGLAKGSHLTLWIGAIGPLSATVAADDEHTLCFNGTIHPAIVEHFQQMV